MTDLIVRTDLRSKFSIVRDQGRRPTCLAFAASACHEHAHAAPEPFSAEWLYYHAVQCDGGGPEDGCSPPDVCDVLADVGQCRETDWPYSREVARPWTPPVHITDIFHADEVSSTLDFGEIIAAIDAERPFVLGLYIGATFYAPARLGAEAQIIDDLDDVDPDSGHAVLAVGSGVLNGADMLLVRNSWGRVWGADGYAWLSQSYWDRRAVAAFGLKARP